MTASRRLSRWQIGATVAIVVLTAIATTLGLLIPGLYDEIPVYRSALFLQDAIVLGLAVPVLATSLWFAVRGSARGEIVWLGTLAFMTYLWASQSLVLAYNDALVLHITLLGLSAFTLASGLLGHDPTALADSVRTRLPRRLYLGYLGFVALGLCALWLSELLEPLVAGGVPAGVERMGPLSKNTNVFDLALIVPSLAIVGAWLYWDRDWAYSLTGVLVVFAALLAPAITGMTITLATGGIEMNGVVLAGSIVPPVIGIAVAVRFVLAIPRRKRAQPVEASGVPG